MRHLIYLSLTAFLASSSLTAGNSDTGAILKGYYTIGEKAYGFIQFADYSQSGWVLLEEPYASMEVVSADEITLKLDVETTKRVIAQSHYQLTETTGASPSSGTPTRPTELTTALSESVKPTASQWTSLSLSLSGSSTATQASETSLANNLPATPTKTKRPRINRVNSGALRLKNASDLAKMGLTPAKVSTKTAPIRYNVQ